jgi:hypothetical protein
MKRKLLGVVANNFDLADEQFDASLFRTHVEKAINKLELPVMKVDCQHSINSIAAKFSGQIKGSSDQTSLQQALVEASNSALGNLADGLEKGAATFRMSLVSISEELQNDLLQNMNEEFERILNDLDNKDASIQRLNKYIVELGNMEKVIM